MDVKVGDLVLVLHGSLLLDAEVKEAKSDDQVAEMRSKKLLVHYLVDLDRADEWVTQDRVLEDTPTSRELQTKGEDSSQSKSERPVLQPPLTSSVGLNDWMPLPRG
ncbi:uncharacterized protein KRP23_12011 [Phytophthora ramorum]|uniref:uncharacterized protein n=1 Tax=Phytophthora ramorum TaxID=164328 RepID=UPI003094B3E3|nr:hypothetical protein KRP23_12011 [Phytophthora ramorum]